MAEPSLLFVTSDGVFAYSWLQGRTAKEAEFPPDENGRRQFAQFAAQLAARRRPVMMLVDLVEEDFRFDVVPHVLGSERRLLLERKLDQFYRSTPFRHAEIREREKEGRRDDRILFSAITNPTWISPWAELLLQHEIPLRGVYSVPLVSQQIAKLTGGEDVLLLTWEQRAGVRQTYFKGSHVSFSRLTPLAAGSQFALTVVTETARTLQYLQSLSLLPPEAPLQVVVVCSAKDRQDLSSRLKSTQRVRYVFLDIGELAAKVEFRTPVTDSDCTQLLLHLLAKTRPANQYGTEQYIHFHALGELRRFGALAAGLIAAGFVLWAALDLYQGWTLSQRASDLRLQAQTLDNQYRAITSTFPQTPMSASEMRNLVLNMRALTGATPMPADVLAQIGEALSQFPGIQLNKISWQVTANPDSVRTGVAQAGASPQPQPGAGMLRPAAAPRLYRVVLLSGEISPFDQNFRAALDKVEALQAELTRLGMSVVPLELPLDLRPQAALAGDLAATAAAGRRATFALKIVQEPGA